MEEQKIAKIDEKEKSKGVIYITDNDNMFIAAENISQEEINKLSLETDRNALKEKLAVIEAELANYEQTSEPVKSEEKEHIEEIERPQPYSVQQGNASQIHFSTKPFGNFKNILIFDTETTGLSPYTDELLQISAVDINGTPLLNSYVKPEKHTEWPEAQAVNHISPETVKNAPTFKELKDQMQKLIDNADLIVTYNGKFDMDFLQLNGIKVDPQKPHLDVMKAFAPVYGEKFKNGQPKTKKLVEAAGYYGFDFKAHDSLGDSLATLKIGQKLYGNSFERLTQDDLSKYSISKTLPQSMERDDKEYESFIFKTGSMALNNAAILEQVKNDPFARKVQNLLQKYADHPENEKNLNNLKFNLGRYVADNNPELIENFSKRRKDRNTAMAINDNIENQNVLNGADVLPDFTVQTKNGSKMYSGMKVVYQNPENNTFYLDNGNEKLILPAATFQSIVSPESLHPQPQAFKDAEIAEEMPAAVMGKTVLPEFAMITTQGIQTFKDLTVQKYNAAENSYTLTNGETSITVTGDTFKEINKPERYEKVYDEKTPAYEKLIDSQYDAYFKQRENTANNFIHNLSVYCRKEANTPLDALTISKEIISRMDKEEKEKTRLLLKQIAKEDQTINQVLVNAYYDAVKGVPLDKDTVLQKRNEERIAKPFNDTISAQGALVDSNSKLRIGDTIKDMAFNVPKAFGHGKDRIFEDLTVVSASKDGNNIILMDKNRSFYEMPRDSVLEGYNKQQEKQQKAEQKHRMKNRVDVGWER